MKTNNKKNLNIAKVSKSSESSLNKAVKNVKEILKNNDDNKVKKQKKLLKTLKEENIIKIDSKDSPAAILKKPVGKKNLKNNNSDGDDKNERGVVYIGHIPHGFYEEQMKKFFSQFGKVTNVRVSRSKVSGKPRGYGFIEFAHTEVAKIAADSMNNYLMFGRLVKTEYIPPEKQHNWYFKGLSYTRRSFPKLWNRELHIKRINGSSIGDSNLKSLVADGAIVEAEGKREDQDLAVKRKLWNLSLVASKLKKKGVKIDMKLGDVNI
ncbi:MKI67 FHA domain-interacting nucleolar phosphoprotein [Microplitis mediator]|uniref:MKI67 FHA domain-interacting nucleolar phosphoprotein n=1 Tax=Microplitis mediator TaxID=375433 RepID=UPI002553949A|nr:MKI67 FHA domain-interacting nucleolar phosphoprotein [Microplitis mediator]